jgi:hypothetical protein
MQSIAEKVDDFSGRRSCGSRDRTLSTHEPFPSVDAGGFLLGCRLAAGLDLLLLF